MKRQRAKQKVIRRIRKGNIAEKQTNRAPASTNSSLEERVIELRDTLRDLASRLETNELNIANLRAELNTLRYPEKDSGSRRSSLGAISEIGGSPIDRNAVKDAGVRLK